MEANRLSAVFFWRALIYLLITMILSFFAENLFVNELYYSQTMVFVLLSILLLGQSLVANLEIKPSGLQAFLLADLFFTMVIVRATGGAASPFVVLFPIVTLATSFSFRSRTVVGVVAAVSLALMSIGVGFTVSILGNALAIAATTLLGRYLVEALDASGAQLKVSESERRRLENIQKAILSNIPSGLMSVDPSGHVIQINPMGLRILGRQEREVLRHAITYLLPSIETELLKLSTVIPVLSSDTQPERRALVYRRPSGGEEIQLGYTVVRLTDPDSSQVLGSLVMFQDLTILMRLEEELRRSEKLAAIGKLAAGIAHEIRNPLASISGSAQLLQETPGINDENSTLLKIISRESFRLDALITEFLDFVKPEKVTIGTVDFRALVASLMESLKVNRKWTDLGTTIEYEGVSAACTVMGDAAKLEQVLLNLILNAGQAGAQHVKVEWIPEGGFRVLDDGAGVPESLRSQIFEPFFTTKPAGTGLGLSVTHRLIEAMGGNIAVISPARDFCKDRGTIFEVRLKT